MVRVYSGVVNDFMYDHNSDIISLECKDKLASVLDDEIPYVGIYERKDSKELTYRPIVYGKRARVPLIKQYPEDTEGEFHLLGDYRYIEGYGLDSFELHTNNNEPEITSLTHPLLVYLNEYARVPHSVPTDIGWWNDMATSQTNDGESLGTIPPEQYTFDNNGFTFISKYVDVMVDAGGLEWELQYRPANLWSNDLIMVFQSLRGVSPTIPDNLTQTEPGGTKLYNFVKPENGIVQDSQFVWHMPFSEDVDLQVTDTISNINIKGLVSHVSGDIGYDVVGPITGNGLFQANTRDKFFEDMPRMFVWNESRLKLFLKNRGFRGPSNRGRNSLTDDQAQQLMEQFGINNISYYKKYFDSGPIDECKLVPIFYYPETGSQGGDLDNPPSPLTQGIQIIGIRVISNDMVSNIAWHATLGGEFTPTQPPPYGGGRVQWYDILFYDNPVKINEWYAYGKHYWNMKSTYFGHDYSADFFTWSNIGPNWGGTAIETQISDFMKDKYGGEDVNGYPNRDYTWTKRPFGWNSQYFDMYPQFWNSWYTNVPFGYDGFTNSSSQQGTTMSYECDGEGINWNHFRWNTVYQIHGSFAEGFISGFDRFRWENTYGPPMAPLNYTPAFEYAGEVYTNVAPNPITTQDFLNALSDGGGIELTEVLNPNETGTTGYANNGPSFENVSYRKHNHFFNGKGDVTELLHAEGTASNYWDDGFIFFVNPMVWTEADYRANREIILDDGYPTGETDYETEVELPDWDLCCTTFKSHILPLTPFTPCNDDYPNDLASGNHYRYYPSSASARGDYWRLELLSTGQGDSLDITDYTYFTIRDSNTTRDIARVNMELEGSTITPASDRVLRKAFNLSENAQPKNVLNQITGDLVWKIYPNADGQPVPQDDDDFKIVIGVCNRDEQIGFDVNNTPANAFNYGETYGISLVNDELLQNSISAWNYDTGAFNQIFVDAYVVSPVNNAEINIAKLQWGNLFVKQYTLASGAHKGKYFADTRGRITTQEINPLGLNQGELIQNPAHIICDLASELGIPDDYFDQDSFTTMASIHDNISLGFAITENTTYGDFLVDMCKSTMSIPYYKVSNGKYSAFTFKKTYSIVDIVKEINVANVLRFNLKQTDYDNIATKYQVEYDYDYEQKIYKKRTEIRDVLSLLPNYNPQYFKKDTLKVIQTKYVSGSNTTAYYLRDWYARYYCNPHLIINFTLPLHDGIELEVGDVISFNDVIAGKTAFGKDYSINAQGEDLMFNGTDLYPNFTIYSITKAQETITIECVQNHNLSNQELNPSVVPTYSESETGVDEYIPQPGGEEPDDDTDDYDDGDDNGDDNGDDTGDDNGDDNGDGTEPNPYQEFVDLVAQWDETYSIGWRAMAPIYMSDEFLNDVLFPLWMQNTYFLYLNDVTNSGSLTGLTFTGDINEDRNIDILDIIGLVSVVLGSTELTADNFMAFLAKGDINKDGSMNILDVVSLVTWILR